MPKTFTERIYTESGRDFSWARKDALVVYNLGSGRQAYEGVVGVDAIDCGTGGIVHDLARVPWPMKDSSVDLLVSFHAFEHLDDLALVMKEAHRTLKPGGRIVIEVPYFRHPGAFQDPTHKHFFTSKTMDYFCRTGPDYTKNALRQIDFWYGWPHSKSRLAGWIKGIARRHPTFFDTYLSLIFPFPIIVFELEALK